MESRRDSLKIIGAASLLPFTASELPGQHTHDQAGKQAVPAVAGPFTPKFFNPHELAVVSRLAGLIIPDTATPGALAAGVPRYIDGMVAASPELRVRYREGVPALEASARKKFGKTFLKLTAAEQIEFLTPLCELADKMDSKPAEVPFFRAVKSMTAEGYSTSQIGLETELGYQGNVALASFPGCTGTHQA
jgi:hypothetical protein